MTPPSLSPWDLSMFTALTTLGALFIHVESYSICPFVTGLFDSIHYSQGSPGLWNVPKFPSFSRMNNIPLCEKPWAPSLSKSNLLSNGQVLWETTAQVSKGTGASTNELQWMQGSGASRPQHTWRTNQVPSREWLGDSQCLSAYRLLGTGDRQEKYMCSGHSHSREDNKNLEPGIPGQLWGGVCGVVWCGVVEKVLGAGPRKAFEGSL